MFTLALTSPDVNLSGDKECLHWLVYVPITAITMTNVLTIAKNFMNNFVIAAVTYQAIRFPKEKC